MSEVSTDRAPLVAPEPVTAVSPAEADKMIAVEPERVPALDALVTQYVSQVVTLDPASKDFAKRADDVRTMGDKDMQGASAVSSRLLQKSMKEMEKSGPGAALPKTLLSLRKEIEELDPKQATGVKKFLGLIPFGDALTDYFRKYESSQEQLDGIINSLADGKDELIRDNADLEQEKRNLWATMLRLREFTYIAAQMDSQLVAAIAEIRLTDEARAKTLEEEVLFYVRQKRQDLLTQQAVSAQGYLTIDLIRRNNLELIKGVDRATTTTIAALRTAVIISQALSTQKLVLAQITALNDTTEGLIVTSSEMLRTQSADIQKQAASSTIGLDKLKLAFDNVYAAMDEVDTFKQAALVSMEETINGLSDEIDRTHSYIEKVRTSSASTSGAPAGVELPA